MKPQRNTVNTPIFVPFIAIASISFIGCAAAFDPPSSTDAVNQNPDPAAVDATPFSVVPEKLTEAVTTAASSAQAFNSCVQNASINTLTDCNESYVQSIADALAVTLPGVPGDKLMGCAANGVECTLNSASTDALDGCAADLAGCANDTEQVIEVVDGLDECAAKKIRCVSKAGGGDALLKCVEDEFNCVASGLGATLPEIPMVTDMAACADQAVQCAAISLQPPELAACAENLSACAAGTIMPTDTRPTSDCIFAGAGAAIGGMMAVEGGIAIAAVAAPVIAAVAPPLIDCASKFAACIIELPLNIATCAERIPAMCK